MIKSDSIIELSKALACVQAEIENVSKNAENEYFSSKYADLPSVLNVVRPVLTKHGLSIAQLPGYEPGCATVETILCHNSGEFISGIAKCKLTKDDPQGYGSAVTYLRRYSIAAMVGIGQFDDDANEASQGAKPATSEKLVINETKTAQAGPVVATAATPAVAAAPKPVPQRASEEETANTWIVKIGSADVNKLPAIEAAMVTQFKDPALLAKIKVALVQRKVELSK